MARNSASRKFLKRKFNTSTHNLNLPTPPPITTPPDVPSNNPNPTLLNTLPNPTLISFTQPNPTYPTKKQKINRRKKKIYRQKIKDRKINNKKKKTNNHVTFHCTKTWKNNIKKQQKFKQTTKKQSIHNP